MATPFRKFGLIFIGLGALASAGCNQFGYGPDWTPPVRSPNGNLVQSLNQLLGIRGDQPYRSPDTVWDPTPFTPRGFGQDEQQPRPGEAIVRLEDVDPATAQLWANDAMQRGTQIQDRFAQRFPTYNWNATSSESVMGSNVAIGTAHSVRRLDQAYPQAIPLANSTLDRLGAMVETFDVTQRGPNAPQIKQAALRFLSSSYISGHGFGWATLVDTDTGLTAVQFLSLSWYAIHDTGVYTDEEIEFRKWELIHNLGRIQRAHNDDGSGTVLFNGSADSPACGTGTYKRLIEHLDGAHPLVRVQPLNQMNDEVIRTQLEVQHQILFGSNTFENQRLLRKLADPNSDWEVGEEYRARVARGNYRRSLIAAVRAAFISNPEAGPLIAVYETAPGGRVSEDDNLSDDNIGNAFIDSRLAPALTQALNQAPARAVPQLTDAQIRANFRAELRRRPPALQPAEQLQVAPVEQVGVTPPVLPLFEVPEPLGVLDPHQADHHGGIHHNGIHDGIHDGIQMGFPADFTTDFTPFTTDFTDGFFRL